MTIEQKEKAIGANSFQCTQFGGIKSLQIKWKITRSFSPLVKVIKSFVEKNDIDVSSVMDQDLSKINFDPVIEAAQDIIMGLDPEEFTDFVLDILSGTSIKINDKFQLIDRDIFNHKFNEISTIELFKIIKFVIEINYPDFFSLLDTGNILKKSETDD